MSDIAIYLIMGAISGIGIAVANAIGRVQGIRMAYTHIANEDAKFHQEILNIIARKK